MKIINETTDFIIEENTVVAIGKFDGFHRGHQKLLEEINSYKRKGLATVVFTFVPSPAVFFSNELVQELSTIGEKRRFFEKAGVDYLIEYPFYQEIADMSPVTFIRDVLVNKIHASCIVAGEDVSYGKAGKGDYKLLKEKAEEYGYDVVIIDKVLYGEREISSTFVRDEVKAGNVGLVRELLGMPYHIGGEVVHGKKLGRTIGMPTVNLIPPKEKLMPSYGVYYSYVIIRGKRYEGITNIGLKPTVDDSQSVGVETYIYNFEDDVYGKEIDVYLLEYKRPEMKFECFEELKAQMQKDMEEGKLFHGI